MKTERVSNPQHWHHSQLDTNPLPIRPILNGPCLVTLGRWHWDLWSLVDFSLDGKRDPSAPRLNAVNGIHHIFALAKSSYIHVSSCFRAIDKCGEPTGTPCPYVTCLIMIYTCVYCMYCTWLYIRYIYICIYIIIHIYTAYIHNYCVQLMYNVIYITELNSTYPTAVPPPILGRKPWLSFQPQPQQEQSRSGTDVHPGPWPMEDLGAFGFVQNRVSSKKNMGP